MKPIPYRTYQRVIQAIPDTPIYAFAAALNPTVAMDLFSITVAAGYVVRLRQLSLNVGTQTTAAAVQLGLERVTTRGSGGTLLTPSSPFGDEDPSPCTSIIRTGDTTIASGSPQILVAGGGIPVYVPATASPAAGIIDFEFHPEHKPPTVTAIPSNPAVRTLRLKHPGATGAANFIIYVEFTEEPIKDPTGGP